jgi:uncharacterized protein (TIGR00730 family)
MNIAVYCGSSLGTHEAYAERGAELGAWMASEGHTLVYGAGRVGIMGAVSDAVLAGGGHAIGVIPQFMIDREWGRRDLGELYIVKDMHERKKRMIDLSDAFVALPGGAGTLEEITEVASWQGLELIDAPCLVYNVDGYYDDLRAFFARMESAGFLSERPHSRVRFPETLAEVQALLHHADGASK